MIDVVIREEGPREGAQFLKGVLPLADKIKLVELLTAANLSSIQVTSFVRPDKVPQMADADELASKLPKSERTRFSGLYLNERGFERACAAKNLNNEGCILISAHDAFLQKNSNSSLEQEIEKFENWKQLFKKHKCRFDRLMISTAFGYDQQEDGKAALRTLEMVINKLSQLEFLPTEITFADTAGLAVPLAVTKICKSFRELYPEFELGFHFHDNRGLAVANALVALAEGVQSFDSSIAGVGGCPFIPDAAGNIATEELVLLCESEGVKTGIDLNALMEAAKFASTLFKTNSKLLASW